MIKDIHFTSRHHAERIDGRPDVIVVSIHDRHGQPKLRSGFRDVLRLAFDDYDRERDGIDALMEPLSPEQADTLKHWLETYLRTLDSAIEPPPIPEDAPAIPQARSPQPIVDPDFKTVD